MPREISRKLAVETLGVCCAARLPVLMWGEPGIGKTRTIEGMAKSLTHDTGEFWPCETVLLSVRRPDEVAGSQIVDPKNGEFTVVAPPSWVKRLKTQGRGILFLDELTTAAPLVQKAGLRIVLDRVVGESSLPDEVIVIAAANPPDIATEGWDLSGPLANRFIHLDWPVDTAEWLTGMVSGFKSPKVPIIPKVQLAASRLRALGLVMAYLHDHPEHAQAMPVDPAAQGRAWPSHRSWTVAMDALAAATAVGHELVDHIEGSVIGTAMAGSVGDVATKGFLEFAANANIPDPEAVLANPQIFDPVAANGTSLAAMGGVVAAVGANLTEERWAAAWGVLNFVAKAGKPEVAIFAAPGLINMRNRLIAEGNTPTDPRALMELVPILQKAGVSFGSKHS